MKKYLKLATIFFFGILAINTSYLVSAQTSEEFTNTDTETKIVDFAGLRAELNQKVQDPVSKEIIFELKLKSNISSDRVRITWLMTGVSIFVNESETTRVIEIRSGETYVIPIRVLPTKKGVTEIFGKVESYGVTTTTLVTVRKNFITNDSGENMIIKNGTTLVYPDDYNEARNRYIAVNIFTYVLALVVAIASIILGYRIFRKWLNKDDQKIVSTE